MSHVSLFYVQPTSDLPLPPAETLAQARESLLETFKKNFADASAARDSANTSRFFKLFPAIGWEKEGLEAYSDFVVDLVRARATVSGKSKQDPADACHESNLSPQPRRPCTTLPHLLPFLRASLSSWINTNPLSRNIMDRVRCCRSLAGCCRSVIGLSRA